MAAMKQCGECLTGRWMAFKENKLSAGPHRAWPGEQVAEANYYGLDDPDSIPGEAKLRKIRSFGEERRLRFRWIRQEPHRKPRF
jgi:hypothetical protein